MALSNPRLLLKPTTPIFIVATAGTVITCRNSHELEHITNAFSHAGISYTVTELEFTL